MKFRNREHWRLDYYSLICFGNPELGVFRVSPGEESMHGDRMFNFTSPGAKEIFEGSIARLAYLPTLIVAESSLTDSEESKPAILARLSNVRKTDNDEAAFNYRHLSMRLTAEEVFTNFFVPEPVLRYRIPENLKTHWAVKEGNLIEKLSEFWEHQRMGSKPKVFSLDKWPLAKRDHIAVMMPFSAEFGLFTNPLKKRVSRLVATR